MSNYIKLALLILLILMAPDTAAICKWIDEDGGVHYAETCPEDSAATEVRIHAPPTQEQVEETTRRSQIIQKDTQARSEQRAQEEEQERLDKQTREDTREDVTDKCAEARWNLGILKKPLPVYFDQENLLHFNRSIHDTWYEGQRNYLDDQQRQAEIRHYTQVEEQTCTAREADIRERIRIYMEKSHRDACLSLRNRLKNMQAASTGIPSDKMRDLEDLINTRCQ